MTQVVNLTGKKGLIVGIANADSIAFGCAQALKGAGADLAITFLNEKAERHVRPLADSLEASLLLPLNVEVDGQMEAVFEEIERQWGKLDFVIHSIAFAPLEDLHGRVVDSSAEGFARAMNISCHSFIRMAKQAEPLMTDGGSLISMSYYGSEKVIQNYGIMGPVKAALESVTKYMAAELGEKGIRVHAISPGPMPTRAASGISGFDELLRVAAERAPKKCLATPADVGATTAFLCSDAARSITGSIMHVDCGYHIMG